MSELYNTAKTMGDALCKNATELNNQFVTLKEQVDSKSQTIQDDIASLNDKFTFMLEYMTKFESMLTTLLNTNHSSKPISIEEESQTDTKQVEEEEEEPDVIITKVVQGEPKEVVVKDEEDEVSIEIIETVEAAEAVEAEAEAEAEVVEAEAEVEEAEAETVEAEAETEVEEEEEELSLVVKTLKAHDGSGKKKYYVTDDEEREIYEILADEEPGDEPIGKLKAHGKSFRAYYFKTK